MQFLAGDEFLSSSNTRQYPICSVRITFSNGVFCAMNLVNHHDLIRRLRYIAIVVPLSVVQLLVVLLSAASIVHAQNDPGTAGDGNRLRVARRYVVNKISFITEQDSTGGYVPSDIELGSLINSRSCDFSITSRILRTLTYEAFQYSQVPAGVKTTLAEFYTQSSKNELRYFDKTLANIDALILRDYFTQLGYHDANVRFEFRISADQRNNVLMFKIISGRQYTLDTIVVTGTEGLPVSVRDEVHRIASEIDITTFNEPRISALANRMLSVLHDSGYAFARYPVGIDSTSTGENEIVRVPKIQLDTVRKQDSVTIFLEPLSRYRFGSVRFIDSTHGYPFVVHALKRKQLEFSDGQWYNLSTLRRSESSIAALGPFDRVSLDTMAVGDSILTTVFCSYRRPWELRPSIFLNNTFPDNFNNIGLDVNYLNRNIFHDAQVLNLYARWTLRNIDYIATNLSNNPNVDQEYETGLLASQPDFLRIAGKRIDGSFQTNYSYRAIVDPMKVHTLNARISPFVMLSENTARLQLDIIAEAQLPKNFQGSYESAYRQIIERNPTIDTTNLRQFLRDRLDPYQKLDSYTSNGTQFRATSFILALNYFIDKRNDIFFPARGYTVNVVSEWTPLGLLTDFLRLQGTYTWYGTMNTQTTQAFKARVGHILWFNREEKIVPSDRHYFAGGSASIRSFASRQLGNPNSDDPNLPSNVGDLANYVGWATIIELSGEVRYTFPYYPELGEFLADKISRLGFTFFVDAGNAFNRFTPAAYGKASVRDVLDPRNWALAAGTGIRFATPVGPARLDFGINVYDPTIINSHYSWITSRKFLESITAQIGLGHAF